MQSGEPVRAKRASYLGVWLWLTAAVAVIVISIWLLAITFQPSLESGYWMFAWRRFPRCAHARFRPGMTRAEVVSRFGKPWHTIKSSKDLAHWQQDRSYVPPPPGPYRRPILVYSGAGVWRV